MFIDIYCHTNIRWTHSVNDDGYCFFGVFFDVSIDASMWRCKQRPPLSHWCESLVRTSRDISISHETDIASCCFILFWAKYRKPTWWTVSRNISEVCKHIFTSSRTCSFKNVQDISRLSHARTDTLTALTVSKVRHEKFWSSIWGKVWWLSWTALKHKWLHQGDWKSCDPKSWAGRVSTVFLKAVKIQAEFTGHVSLIKIEV